MTEFNSKTPLSRPKPTNNEIANTNRIRIGGGFRLPKSDIVDNGRIRVGGGFRLPTP